MQVSFTTDTDSHANLTEFVALIGFCKYNLTSRRQQVVVAMPSQAFKRQDGSLTVQSRLSGNTVRGLRPRTYTWCGIRANGLTEPLTF